MGSTTLTPATGNGPFEFTDAEGRQWSIPLTAIKFSGNQYVIDPVWVTQLSLKPAENAAAIAKAFLTYSVNEGNITPVSAASPFPAMLIQAATSGAAGNNIQLQVAISSLVASPPVNDPTQTQFSLTVTETDTYQGLTPATIQSQLQNQGALVQVQSVTPIGSPVPVSNTLQLSGSPASNAQLVVYDNGSPSLPLFTLVAKGSGPDGELTQVTIASDSGSPSSGPDTFTLTATWTKTVSGITVQTLASVVAGNFSYEIGVIKPSSGAFSVPAAGSSTLTGGAQFSNAAATLFTGQ
jgi:hypothetical protein